jgi:hypothetical protein
MNNMGQEKTDVVSAILDNTDLLDAFADTLVIEEIREDSLSSISASLGRMQKIKCYLWKKAKDVMNKLSNKIQVLAVLAEYNFKNEEKKIQIALIKKD